MVTLRNGRQIGGDAPCFIVAEAGLAHEGDFDKAKQLIDLAFAAKADAVKFQAYRTDELIDRDRAPEMYERFKKKELSYDSLYKLKEYAEKTGILWFCTPHTVGAFEVLQDMDVELWKIGSGEKGTYTILDLCIGTGKPVIISTGMRTRKEIWVLIVNYGSDRTFFLHCITMYPCTAKSLNLAFLKTLEKKCDEFGSGFGYSDHYFGTSAAIIAASLGAEIIEKHIKLPESTGQDVHGALDKMNFANMVKKIRHIELLRGKNERIYSEEERKNESWALKGKDGKRPI